MVWSFRLAAAVVVLSAFAAPTTTRARDIDAQAPWLRAADPHIAGLIASGLKHSPSFRTLVARIEQSDLVVYVRCAVLPEHLDGALTFVSAVGGRRYVMVRLAMTRTRRQKVAALGHELQHAVEIAERADIVDAASMARAFREFGFERVPHGPAAQAFDSLAAIDAGHQVRREAARMSDSEE